jgi:hypothetical protein
LNGSFALSYTILGELITPRNRRDGFMRRGLSKFPTMLGLVLATFIALDVSAASVEMETIPGISTSGGSFKATVQPGSSIGIYGPGASFQTFCVEVNEEFSSTGVYTAVASTESVFGGGSSLQNAGTNEYGSNGFVPLAPEVAYLYTHFMSDTMSSVVGASWHGTLASSDAASVESLQNAIWHFMGYTYADGSTSITSALESAATTAVHGAIPTWSGLGNVRIMQLWTSPTLRTSDFKAQDQLVLVPTPSASLAGMSLLSGLALVGWIKRGRIRSL